MNQPLVSVVIPFHCNKKWLIEALDSVVNQTYKNIEILVINDGSLENIDDILVKYGSKLKVIYKENGGPASARNLGIEKSTGKYVSFLDSDDIWMPNKLTKQINEMESKGYIWSQHSYRMFWENRAKTKIINTEIYSGNVYRDCFISFKIQTSCVVVLRSILFEKNIRFPLKKRYGQDGDFYRQIAKHFPIGSVKGVLSGFRIRGTNAGFRAKVQINSKAKLWKEIRGDHNILHILPGPVILAYKMSSILSVLLNFLNKKIINKEKYIEMLSKIMYMLPYSVFKFYAKKSTPY